MISRNIGLSGAWVIGSLIAGAMGAIAHPLPAPPVTRAAPTELAAAALSAEAVIFEAWSVPDLFAIEVPTGWLTAAFAEEARAVITSYDATAHRRCRPTWRPKLRSCPNRQRPTCRSNWML
jgi:hypothetical protein